jgi:AGCS family alanine or glycine:cation symporter
LGKGQNSRSKGIIKKEGENSVMIEMIATVNTFVNNIVWGPVGLALLFVAGLVMTMRTGAFQFTHFAHWMKNTIGAIFTNRNITAHTSKEDHAISQFQSLCTALAATIGTGNIVGVASAIISGGPGAIFWMWVMAILGMMTNYSENVLGIYYRRKNEKGEWSGGAMYYLTDGLGSKKHCKTLGRVLAVLFACFCVLASFGIGNMSQVNSIAGNMNAAFNIPTWVTGLLLVILSALVIVGGLKTVAAVTEKIVPFMAILYIVGALVVVGVHYSLVPAAFAAIFKGAFGAHAVGGGILGYGISRAITWGFKRGAFSNEAGLGSSVMVHSSSNVKEPVQQGMWGVFEVFADTIVVCTLTALAILCSDLVDLETGTMLTSTAGSALAGEAFSTVFGALGPKFIAISILLFAYSTVLGWSHYGTKAFEYLFGTKATTGYKIFFVLLVFGGATMKLDLAWDLSDTFNGLMMIPNLIGVLALSGTVKAITQNYLQRTFHGAKIRPMWSAFENYQKEEEADAAAGR